MVDGGTRWKGSAPPAGSGKSIGRDLLQLVYVSAAVRELSESEIGAIADRSRANNEARGLTGFLLHQNVFFYGLLEGARRKVFDRMEVIITDPRHRDLRILREGEIDTRRFQNWTFGTLPATAPGPSPKFGLDDFIVSLSSRLG